MSVIKKSNIKFLVGLFCLFSTTVSFAEVAVIVNKANNATIADSDISRVFLGKVKAFSNGDKITVINLKFKKPARNEFEDKVLNKSASQVKAYWSKLMFSGKGKPPKEFASDKDVLAFVAANQGAIGYIEAASADGSVKVIKTF